MQFVAEFLPRFSSAVLFTTVDVVGVVQFIAPPQFLPHFSSDPFYIFRVHHTPAGLSAYRIFPVIYFRFRVRDVVGVARRRGVRLAIKRSREFDLRPGRGCVRRLWASRSHPVASTPPVYAAAWRLDGGDQPVDVGRSLVFCWSRRRRRRRDNDDDVQGGTTSIASLGLVGR